MESNRPVVRWRGDRWVNHEHTDMCLMPAQVTTRGSFSRAAQAKAVWLRDMSNDVQRALLMETFLVQGKPYQNSQENAVELRDLAAKYRDWAQELKDQGL